MAKSDAAKIWSLNYRLITAVIVNVAAEVATLGLEVKELFLLAQVEESPYPAELAVALSMPKPSVTVALKTLEAEGFIRREIDAADLRRHRILLTPSGRKAMARGMTMMEGAFAARLGRLGTAEQTQLRALLEKLS
jgi:DNA-binding MarR family transcriptional regulator